jgi:hypothetical protein
MAREYHDRVRGRGRDRSAVAVVIVDQDAPGAGHLGQVADKLLQVREDHLPRHAIVPALGDDEVGGALRGLDELQVHGADGLVVLLADRLEGAAAVLDVPADPAQDADVGVGVDEELDVEALADGRLERSTRMPSTTTTGVGIEARLGGSRWWPCEVVDGDVDRSPGAQGVEVLDEELVVEASGWS